jgi:hypothetical protein
MVGLCLALAGAMAIIINALFLQTGPHPAPIFANPVRPARVTEATSSVTSVLPRPRPAELERPDVNPLESVGASTKSGIVKPAMGQISAASPRRDPIADLLEPSNRLLSVQRALAEFGYGQIRPTGISDIATKAAIEKFERDRKLPVTGQVSDRVVRELTTIKGGPL